MLTRTGAPAASLSRCAKILRALSRPCERPPTDSSDSSVQARIALRMRSSVASSASPAPSFRAVVSGCLAAQDAQVTSDCALDRAREQAPEGDTEPAAGCCIQQYFA